MRRGVFSAVLLMALSACGSGGGSGSSAGHEGNKLVPEEFVRLPVLKEDEIRYLGTQLALLNDPDRNRQRQALDNIHRFGLRAVPVLLSALERAHASARQGCLESLRALHKDEAVMRDTGAKVPNAPILAAWYLNELERQYRDLPPPLKFYEGEEREDTSETRRDSREQYRQNLCLLYGEVARPDLTHRFLDAVVEDDSDLVRAAAYNACNQVATSAHLPRLIEVYQREKDLPRKYLWGTLKGLTGRHYPDDPRIWMTWLKRGGAR